MPPLGVVLAYWMDKALVALAPQQISGGELILDVGPDWRLLLYAMAVAALVCILCSIGPALQSGRMDLGSSLNQAMGFLYPEAPLS